MTVYADTVILVNFFIDYILLYLTSVFLHLNVKFKRLLFASVLGALFALIGTCFFLGHTLFRLIFGLVTLVIVCRTAYGRLMPVIMIKSMVALIMFSTALGGVVTLLYSQNTELKKAGAVALPICCFILLYFYRILNEMFSCEVKGKRVEVLIEMFDAEYKVVLFSDSGNLLVDPYTKLPIIVLSCRFNRCHEFSEPRLVPVSTACGSMLMEVITPRRIYTVIDKKNVLIKAVVGFSNSDICFNGCDGIISCELANTYEKVN